MLGRLVLLATLLVPLSAGSALAETDFPIVGGPGNVSFQDRCPPGQYLVGINGRAGSWVNQVQMVCAAVTLNGRGPNHINIISGRSIGAARGGGGGGGTGQSCAGLVVGIWPHMTPGNRQVKYIDMWCQDENGFRPNGPIRFNGFTNPGTDVNGGADQPHLEMCPGQDAAVGLQGRYGADLNAVSLICVPLTAPMVSSAIPPPPQNTRPIKTTGQATGAPQSGPVFDPNADAADTSNFPAPPATQRTLMPGPFFGDWTITAGDGTTFTANIHQVSGALQNHVTVTFTSQPPPNVKVIGGYTMNVKSYVHLTIMAGGQKGDLLLTASPDGQSFAGVGHLADGTSVSWNGQLAQPTDTGAMPPATPPADTPPPPPDPGE
ncbi:MAG TPA: hypothetical protein VGF97_18755 [Rhizomicrobium sp.]|jgi:hypothetical protein